MSVKTFTTTLQITQYNDAARNPTIIPKHSIWTLQLHWLGTLVLSLGMKLPHYNLESPHVLHSYILGHCNLGSHTPTRLVLIYVQYSAIRLPDSYSKTFDTI